jgi:IclR family transcriptional regulator, acetate operon repressor
MTADVPAVVNAVRLLERIARDWPDPVPSGTLIEELNLNRSTAYNILGTLQRAGWAATRGDRGGWSLGPRLLAIAPAGDDWTAAIVHEELDALSQRLGYIAFVAEWDGADRYSVRAKADRGKGVHITVGLGETFPFSAPALMRAFHAWSDPAAVDRLIERFGIQPFTPETVVEPDRVREVMAETRRRGYGASVREYDLGQSGVAAPVFDAAGRVTLAVVVLAFSSELNESTAGRVGAAVRACAQAITARTGGAPPRPAPAPGEERQTADRPTR